MLDFTSIMVGGKQAVFEAICEYESGAAPLQASYPRWIPLALAMLVVAAVV
jgi:hypothetical protein